MSIIANEYVAHFPEFSSTALQEFAGGRTSAESIPAIRIFLARYQAFPCILSCPHLESNALFHIPSVLNYLKTQLGHDLANDIIFRTYHRRAKEYFVSVRLSDLGNGVMIHLKGVHTVSDVENPNRYAVDFSDDTFLVSQSILIYYLSQCDEEVQKLAKEFSNMSVFTTKSLKLRLISRHRQGRLYLKSITIQKPMIYDLALQYGDEFVRVHETITKQLNKKEGKGIVFLHGIPGSGKTHYIRYLIESITDKTIIYVPPDIAKEISKPDFLTFLLTQRNSILIIEGAENIIRDRNEITFDASQAVANLLNLSDGLLGDAMCMQIIATFNCDLGVIDKALLRKGRLIANYEFGKIDVKNAKILSKKLGFTAEYITTAMTLAEIYNQNESETVDISDGVES